VSQSSSKRKRFAGLLLRRNNLWQLFQPKYQMLVSSYPFIILLVAMEVVECGKNGLAVHMSTGESV
jgi:uncharacterized protein YqcC (DUF446 family)